MANVQIDYCIYLSNFPFEWDAPVRAVARMQLPPTPRMMIRFGAVFSRMERGTQSAYARGTHESARQNAT